MTPAADPLLVATARTVARAVPVVQTAATTSRLLYIQTYGDRGSGGINVRQSRFEAAQALAELDLALQELATASASLDTYLANVPETREARG